MESIKIGNKIGWTSAAGYNEGIVKNIVIAKNAAGDLIPWLDIEYKVSLTRSSCVRICASTVGLKMLKVGLV